MPTRVHDDTIAQHPHDGLVKRIFTIREAAAEELRHALPESLCAQLDWSTLEVEPTSFIDPGLQPRTTDILYSICPKGSTTRLSIYVVLEHQSTPDPTMAVRFLVYVGRLYERFLREHPDAKTVPMVIPVLLYQGPGGWTLPRRLSELLDVPEGLTDAFPTPIELAFAVDDLSESLLNEQVSADQLARDRWRMRAEMARTMLWLARNPDATGGQRASALGMLLDLITETFGTSAAEPFLTYFVATFESESPLRGILIEAVNKETRQMYATIRDELIAQGHQRGVSEGKIEGKIEGRAEGKAELLLHVLTTRGLSPSAQQRQRLTRCKDEALIQRWFDRALTAERITELFHD